MKSVMYHYVRPYSADYPYFKNLDFENFSLQLDYFSEQYGFVRKDEFLDCFKTGKLPEGIVLTFDDGLKCHYRYVFKELKRRNLWGIFYVPALPYLEHRFVDVHRIHVLLGRYSGEDIYSYLKKNVSDYMLDDNHRADFDRLTYTTQTNDGYTLLVKRLLNYFIRYEYREKIINVLMEELIPDQNELFKDFYLNEEEILEMNSAGMLFGSHTVNHPVMSRLSLKEQKREISSSFSFLESIIGSSVRTFCYPYGGFFSFSDETEKLLSQFRCLFSFNVEERDINIYDIKNRPQALPRYDCNSFKYGQVRLPSDTKRC